MTVDCVTDCVRGETADARLRSLAGARAMQSAVGRAGLSLQRPHADEWKSLQASHRRLTRNAQLVVRLIKGGVCCGVVLLFISYLISIASLSWHGAD